MAAAETALGPDAAGDLYRGLYISRDEVERLLAREPGTPTFARNEQESNNPLPEAIAAGSRLEWLEYNFGLSSFDIDLPLIALAPELDRRYERLYAYLQDDVRNP